MYTRDRNTFIESASTKLNGCITSLSLSADATEAIAGTSNGMAYRVTTNGLRSLMLCETHAGAVTAVAYAPNLSERFITASEDGTLRLWDASDYTVVVRASVTDGGGRRALRSPSTPSFQDGKMERSGATLRRRGNGSGRFPTRTPAASRRSCCRPTSASSSREVKKGTCACGSSGPGSLCPTSRSIP